ncbi:hypothetical protein, partial [Clostridium perfringens]|uniref:hypothetical protein n=1 Tax=Clostridium perfringens TaxID=1502 RepID=UPI002ACBEB28
MRGLAPPRFPSRFCVAPAIEKIAEVKSKKRNLKTAKSLVESRFSAVFLVFSKPRKGSRHLGKMKPFGDVGENSGRTQKEQQQNGPLPTIDKIMKHLLQG